MTQICFGIPTLDGLFEMPGNEKALAGLRIVNPDFSGSGISVPEGETTSMCIAGPEGTGKSVLGLHLASRYFAEGAKLSQPPWVFYISTDLNHDVANKMWRNFGLHLPSLDRDPFHSDSGVAGSRRQRLIKCSPNSLHEDLSSWKNKGPGFIDLAANTAGDDWGFLNRFISVLPPADGSKHLVIVDAVEGFETYVGDLDAYGEKTSRRARIAQIMRVIKGKCHVIFIIEDSGELEKRPEQYVTDVVIKLHKDIHNGYVRRAIEIEKVRGQSFARGSHHYTIRLGKRATTGVQENPDDPQFGRRKPKSYVYVLHSLHHFNRMVMKQEGEGRPEPAPGCYTGFGIRHLDDMLGGDSTSSLVNGFDQRGLPAGSITALIGDSMTQKSKLGIAFLSKAFEPAIDVFHAFRQLQDDPKGGKDLLDHILRILDFGSDSRVKNSVRNACLKALRSGDYSACVQIVEELSESIDADRFGTIVQYYERRRQMIARLKKASGNAESFRQALIEAEIGIAVLLTNYDISIRDLTAKFWNWIRPRHNSRSLNAEEERALFRIINENTICRRLEIHDVSSAIILNIFSKCLLRALERLNLTEIDIDRPDVRALGRIRLVLDDFSNVRALYPDFSNDPLLLPSIKFLLGRLGVTTLVIDTQSGKPDVTVAERFATELRQMAENRIYTWRVPFYGDSRVAIAAIPPLSAEFSGIVRELRWEKEEGDPLVVDPHFELYQGLDESRPSPVALEVKLFAEHPRFFEYISRENRLLNELFTPLSHRTDEGIIEALPATEYDHLRNTSYLQRDTRLDHTRVVQVDEFWGPRIPTRRRSGSFRPQWPYLDAVTRSHEHEDKDTDPYSLFQKGVGLGHGVLRRRDFFDPGLGYQFGALSTSEQGAIERTPFSWDFGFLLCRKNYWEKALGKKLSLDKEVAPGNEREDGARSKPKRKTEKVRVEDVWERLVIVPNKAADDEPGRSTVSWRRFLQACQNVAESASNRLGTKVPVFDVSLHTPEGFSCLILEIWASEIYDSLPTSAAKQSFARSLHSRQWGRSADESYESQSLIKWLDKKSGFQKQLLRTWLLLVDVVDFSEIIGGYNPLSLQFKTHAVSQFAVAGRHWYKSACQYVEENSSGDPIVAVRLPGHFSIRGDWFLAVSGGSRSNRLADRALDLLSSRRANITRLQEGLGLPTRTVSNSDKLRSRLILHGDHDCPEYATYEAVKSLGWTAGNQDSEFYWLWRSSLDGYHRQSNVWHRWLTRLMNWWATNQTRYQSSWLGGFNVYDNFDDPEYMRKMADIQSDFYRMCDALALELSQANL